MLRALLELSRVSNLPTVWTNVLAAWIIASGGRWGWSPALGWMLLGASLVYSAGMVLNDVCDAAWDRENRPERPIPSGRMGLGTAWAIGVVWLGGGSLIMVLAGGANWVMTGLLVAAIVAYDVYHKPWAGSVIVMGACRTLLYLAAGSAAFAAFPPKEEVEVAFPWVWSDVLAGGLVLGFYIVGLSLVARHEGASIKPGMIWRWLGFLGLLSPLAVGAFETLIRYEHAGEASDGVLMAFLALVSTAVLAMPWPPAALLLLIGYATWLMRTPPPSNIGRAVGWLLAGIPVVDALSISMISNDRTVICVFIALVPVLRLWQRWIAAT